MKLIIGLGNPGRKYENTRHNVGFKVACALADRYNIRLNTKAFNSFIGKGRIFSEDVMIALPQIYMNNSGEAARMMFLRKKMEPKDILVICDDVNLELGIIRIRPEGSSGGHKGLESIIDYLDSGDFARLRIGIGKDTGRPGLSGYVLSPFKKNEAKTLEGVIESAVECCEVWIKEGAERAANCFNLKNRKD
ncbi:MAG: aminoacyl-tRNA hydrolase [Candidatus Omnitrophota bacterium]|nr:aminoacyl-tRNA hydrolase [Candidatus Omnitrophota bacterium]